MMVSDLALHRHLGLEVLPVAEDAGHRQHSTAGPVTDTPIARLEAAIDLDGVPVLGVTHVVDGDVVVLAPEERHVGEARAVADDGAGDRLALPLRQYPVLDAHQAAPPRGRPARPLPGRARRPGRAP